MYCKLTAGSTGVGAAAFAPTGNPLGLLIAAVTVALAAAAVYRLLPRFRKGNQ
jgi:hypothetical protein